MSISYRPCLFLKAKPIEISPSSIKFSINPLTNIIYLYTTKLEALDHFMYSNICFLVLDSFQVEEQEDYRNYRIITYLLKFLNLDIIFITLELDYIFDISNISTIVKVLVAPKTKKELSEKNKLESTIRYFFNTYQ